MQAKKILVVDDEIHIVHVVTIKLRNNNYEVITASNGAEALEKVHQDKPDVVITDYQMPVMTGMDLIEKLRENPETQDIPVILLTARSFAVSREQEQALNIGVCVSKPFSPKELLGHVEDVLHQTIQQ